MRFGRGLLGMVGLIDYDLPYKPNNFHEFAIKLAQPCIILTAARKSGIFQRGIEAVTGSPIQHALFYPGKSLAERARKLYPELFGLRKFVCGDKEKVLNPIPKNASEREIVESSLYVRCGSLNEYDSENNQLIAWMKPMTPQEIDAALFQAYLYHGMPYDVQEIASFVSGLPNPEDGKIVLENGREFDAGMKVCSSLVARIFELPLEKPSPADINNYCKNTPGYVRMSFNC